MARRRQRTPKQELVGLLGPIVVCLIGFSMLKTHWHAPLVKAYVDDALTLPERIKQRQKEKDERKEAEKTAKAKAAERKP